jgi:hypothetical protein
MANLEGTPDLILRLNLIPAGLGTQRLYLEEKRNLDEIAHEHLLFFPGQSHGHVLDISD